MNNITHCKHQYDGLYKVSYIPHMRADREWENNNIKYFTGVIDNFNPSGKCVFYDNVKNKILVIQYSNIINIIPLNINESR